MDPLGIADLDGHSAECTSDLDTPAHDHWYWCRKHEQAVHAGAQCKASRTPPSYKVDEFWDAADHMVGTSWEMFYDVSTCIRLGPFMSEREANRLGGRQRGRNMDADSDYAPLGVKVET